MKKLFVTTLIAGSLFFMPAAEAAIEVYVGEGQATMSEDESKSTASRTGTSRRLHQKSIANARS